MELTDLIGETGLSLVTDILRTQGQLRYLGDWDREITQNLARRTFATPLTVRRPAAQTGAMAEHRLVIDRHPAGNQRRFDYALCERVAPVLYHRHVTLTPPERRLSVAFPATTLWSGLRSAGWQVEATPAQQEKRQTVTQPVYLARHLSDLRLRSKRLDEKEDRLRSELSLLISEQQVQRGLADVTAVYHGKGKSRASMRVTKARPHRSVDLDMAESHPQLREFVKTSPMKAYVQVRFVLPEFGVGDDADDSDDSGWSRWKP